MDHRSEVRQFLTSRRARITPEQAGLAASGDNRRVKGLRREEVATLAGVSNVYYTRLERGNLVGVSDSVLEAIARALQLDDAERDHLFDLARTANATASARTRRAASTSRQRISPVVQQVLDAITDAAADVRNARGDIVAANRLGYALYWEIHAESVRPPNVARYTFLNPRAKEFFADWDMAASDIVANLRAGVVVIPKSVRADRMAENFAVFGFELSEDEMARIAGLDTGASLFFDHRDPQIVGQIGNARRPTD